MSKSRNYGIEFVKFLAIIAIVMCHVITTLYVDNQYVPFSDYKINYTLATTSSRNFMLALLSYGGAFGNNVFFICSAWFWIDDDKVSIKKEIGIILDVFFISVLMLITSVLCGIKLDIKMLFRSLLPISTLSYWYITCYVLFYPAHYYINMIVNSLKKFDLAKTSIVLAVLYIGCNFLHESFFSSALILWMSIYFCIAYAKKYMRNICENVRLNLLGFITCVIINSSLVFVTNVMGLKVAYFSDKLIMWHLNCNPFIILAAFCAFNVGRCLNFKWNKVAKISQYGLYIYVIHENMLIRIFIRPFIWEIIYENYGYNHLLIKVGGGNNCYCISEHDAIKCVC